jgi:4-amino-4-deoxychorismate lyase
MSATAVLPAFVDGRIRGAGEGTISIDDEGFLHGLAVFDTLRVEDGTRLFERRHLARLERDARALDIAWPPPWDVVRAWEELEARIEARTFALRTTLTRGAPGGRPSLVVQARAIEDLPRAGVILVLERELRLAGDALERVKCASRARWALARERARAAGAFDALFVARGGARAGARDGPRDGPRDGARDSARDDARDGTVIDATVANVWALVRGRLVTPPVEPVGPLESGALPGITREVLLEELVENRVAHAQAALPLSDLAAADEVFLTNSLQRVIPVTAILGLRSDLPGASGAAAQAARAAVLAREARERA